MPAPRVRASQHRRHLWHGSSWQRRRVLLSVGEQPNGCQLPGGQLAGRRQVILITHLPQIASFADRHLKVFKSVKAGRAITDVILLEGNKRVEEIAQMMSGANATKISISHAQDMLAQAK